MREDTYVGVNNVEIQGLHITGSLVNMGCATHPHDTGSCQLTAQTIGHHHQHHLHHKQALQKTVSWLKAELN